MSRSWNFFGLTAFVSMVALSGCTITTSDDDDDGGLGGGAGSGGDSAAGGDAGSGGTTSVGGGAGGQGGSTTEGGATSAPTLEEAATEACKLTSVAACSGTDDCVGDWVSVADIPPDCTAEITTYLACVGTLTEADVTCSDTVELTVDGCADESAALDTCWGL